MVNSGYGNLKNSPPYEQDLIRENGNTLTIRTYITESTIKIPGWNPNYKIYGGDVLYFLNNQLHRENGPAFIRKNEIYIWAKNGLLHRDGDMPAIESEDDKYRIYCKEGYFHRENGPAFIDGSKEEHWLKGKLIDTEEKFINGVRRIRLGDILYSDEEIDLQILVF